MRTSLLICALAAVLARPAHADETDDDAVSDSVPMSHNPQKRFELKFGVAAGGPAGLLASIKGLETTTTETATASLHLRARLPRISSRVLEAYAVVPSGVGLNLKNDDFRLGNFRFSLLDVGVFWNAVRPVSVQRVDRGLDLTFGTSMEYHFDDEWAVTFDARAFMPSDVFAILTDYGDFARLIGQEVFQGAQLWLGIEYCLF